MYPNANESDLSSRICSAFDSEGNVLPSLARSRVGERLLTALFFSLPGFAFLAPPGSPSSGENPLSPNSSL